MKRNIAISSLNVRYKVKEFLPDCFQYIIHKSLVKIYEPNHILKKYVCTDDWVRMVLRLQITFFPLRKVFYHLDKVEQQLKKRRRAPNNLYTYISFERKAYYI